MTGGGGAGPPGIEAEATAAWLAANVPGARPPFAFSLIAGGRSNLTYLVRDAAGAAWVLRRPPLSGVLPSAHDMGREHRIISALRDTPVPVPEAVGLCGLGRRDGYVGRQLRRWSRQWEQSRTRELPAIEEVGRRLAARVPPQGAATIVHGDYRLDNLVLSPAGEVLAVLDWELCTLGDPLADVGLLLVYWSEPGDEVLPLGSAPTAMPGFPPRQELAAAYARPSGSDLGDLEFYQALGYWKLAVILEGVYARSAAGAYGGGDDTYRGFAAVVARLAERALDATARAGR